MFLRLFVAGERTALSDNEYDEAVHLSVQDIAVDDASHLSVMQFCKNNRKGSISPRNLFVRRKNWVLPVSSFLNDGLSAGTRCKFPGSPLPFC